MNLKNFSTDNYAELFDQIIDLKIPEEQIKDTLLEINELNIPLEAFIGAITSLKKKMKKVSVPFDVIDVCGTGGDGLNTLNVSTAVCFVLASLGVKVAKHGNKGVSSKSGSADIFSELGIEFDDSQEKIIASLEEKNLSFLFAPYFHGALKNVAGIRKSLGIPTIFNFLGPLLNPTNTNTQLIGVSRHDLMGKMLEAAKFFNENSRIYMVHGFDGMDEITITDNSYLIKLQDGEIKNEEIINPEDYGINKVSLKEIEGQDPKYNATKLKGLLSGEKSAYFDIVALNAAFALELSGKSNNVHDALRLINQSRNIIKSS